MMRIDWLVGMSVAAFFVASDAAADGPAVQKVLCATAPPPTIVTPTDLTKSDVSVVC